MTYKAYISINKPVDISYELYVQQIAIPAGMKCSQWVDAAEMNVIAILLKCFFRVFVRIRDGSGYYLSSTVGDLSLDRVIDVLFTHIGNYGHFGK